jgi:hypothetical protein
VSTSLFLQRGLQLFNRQGRPRRSSPLARFLRKQCQQACEAVAVKTPRQDAPLATFSQSAKSPQREITTKLQNATVFCCQEVGREIKPKSWGNALVEPFYTREKTIMIRSSICLALATVVVIMLSLGAAPVANAQCSTCATPTVAYYQPTVAYSPVATQQVRTGWYPGRWFDRRRMSRWGVSTAAAPTYTAAYAPYTAAYAYTPTSYTAAYRPYVTAYAPLSTTSYYTAARQVVMSPVVSACSTCGSEPCGCSPCSGALPACGGCGSCSSCTSGVGQAVYGGSNSGCASCASGSGTPIYSDSAPPIPQPALRPDEVIPDNSHYESQRQESTDSKNDPSPEADSSTFYEAPKLFNPNDRSANRPTVDVHNAVYRQPVANHAISHAPAREVDEHGWSAISRDR